MTPLLKIGVHCREVLIADDPVNLLTGEAIDALLA
jgi:hypothetical protein